MIFSCLSQENPHHFVDWKPATLTWHKGSTWPTPKHHPSHKHWSPQCSAKKKNWCFGTFLWYILPNADMEETFNLGVHPNITTPTHTQKKKHDTASKVHYWLQIGPLEVVRVEGIVAIAHHKRSGRCWNLEKLAEKLGQRRISFQENGEESLSYLSLPIIVSIEWPGIWSFLAPPKIQCWQIEWKFRWGQTCFGGRSASLPRWQRTWQDETCYQVVESKSLQLAYKTCKRMGKQYGFPKPC